MRTCYFILGGLLLAALFALGPVAEAQTLVPGTMPTLRLPAPSALLADKALSPAVTVTGQITASIDGCGSTAPTCTVQVQKPAGGVVRGAWLASASTGGSGRVLNDGDIAINGTPVTWSQQVPSAIFSSNHFASVTAIVKPIVDAAPAGLVNLTLTEVASEGIDGSALVVVFDDPAQTEQSTVVIAFGAQNTAGDTFALTLAEPFSNATQTINLSLGISFGFQHPAIVNQFSTVDVNGTRMTSSAGGQDDGEAANGALITVGGIGDNPSNPDFPFGGPVDGARTDDELYTLNPFIPAGSTNITVRTANPSNDDNIFLATFIIRGTAAIVGEGILLSPASAENPVGTSHTVTATLQNDAGQPISGRAVQFEVLTGPNSGLTSSQTSNASGQASFTWSSMTAGTDVVVARFVNNRGQTISSNTVTKTWTSATVDRTPPVCGAIVVDRENGRVVAMNTTATDAESGIASVTFTTLRNFTGFVGANGPFAQGDTYTPPPGTTSIAIRGERINLALGGAVVARVTNGAGLSSLCDPVVAQLDGAAEAFVLHQNTPNPVGASGTQFRFALAEAGPVRLAIYDALGREVARVVDETMAPGTYSVSWDGQDAFGRRLAPGVYVYRLDAGTFSATQRLTVVR